MQPMQIAARHFAIAWILHSEMFVGERCGKNGVRMEDKTELGACTGGDRTINPDLERWYAKRANSHAVEVPGASHVVYASHPKDVAALIEEAALSLGKAPGKQ